MLCRDSVNSVAGQLGYEMIVYGGAPFILSFVHHTNFLEHILKRKIIIWGLCGVMFLTLLALLSLAVDYLKPALFAFCSFLNLFFSTPVSTIC